MSQKVEGFQLFLGFVILPASCFIAFVVLPPGGGRPSLHCIARQYLLQGFVFPICHTHVLALLSHYFKSVTCVYSVIFSPQRASEMKSLLASVGGHSEPAQPQGHT